MGDDVVLVDTDVFSCVVVTPRDRDPRVTTWRRLLIGKEVALASQTEAELLFGAFSDGWGPRRMGVLRAEIACRVRLAISSEAIDAWARLRADCGGHGHALGAKRTWATPGSQQPPSRTTCRCLLAMASFAVPPGCGFWTADRTKDPPTRAGGSSRCGDAQVSFGFTSVV